MSTALIEVDEVCLLRTGSNDSMTRLRYDHISHHVCVVCVLLVAVRPLENCTLLSCSLSTVSPSKRDSMEPPPDALYTARPKNF